MTRTGVGIRVLIDGKQLDDGCIPWATVDPEDPDYVGQGVSAAAGLSVTWGRATTIDQPQPSTCAFTVVDDPGGRTVLQTLTVGQRVEVFADAVISGGIGTDTTFIDPSFSTEVRGTTRNAILSRSDYRAVDPGGYAATIRPPNPSLSATVTFPPGPLQPSGENPAAWVDLLQSTNPGETWTITLSVLLPPAMTANIRPVLYSAPWAESAVPDASQTVTITDTGEWVRIPVIVYPAASSRWVGFQVELIGPGMRWNDVDPGITWDAYAPDDMRWDDFATAFIDDVAIVAPGAGSASTVEVFSGRITDLEGVYDAEWDAPSVAVTATDFLGDLGNRYVGEEPWPAEPVSDRVSRVLAAAAIPNEPAVNIDIAPTLADVVMSWLDVDKQAAAGLLTDVAQSVDGVLWAASHPALGPYIRFEDPAQRVSLYTLELIDGIITVQPIDTSGWETVPPRVSACDILRDPVTFTLSVSDIATRVVVAWQEQIIDEDGNPATEERRIESVNPSDEVIYGTRAVSVQTILTTDDDAYAVADKLSSRLGASWRIQGVEYSDADVTTPDANAARTLLTFLDGVSRGGQPFIVSDIDDWSPVGTSAPLFVEGGSYVFDGGWALSLIVSRAAGIGQSAAWDDIPNDPAWIWDAWDPGLTWNELRGVAAPTEP